MARGRGNTRRVKFLVVDTVYDRFLESVQAIDPELGAKPFAAQREALLARSFGTADFYSLNLRALGHDAEDMIASHSALQRRWAVEHGIRTRSRRNSRAELFEILDAQLVALKPDVVYVQDIAFTDASLLHAARERGAFIAGQTNYPLPPDLDLSPYDAVFTGMPHYCDMFRRRGVPVEFLRIAFEPAVLDRVGSVPKTFGAVFVGGYAGAQHAPGAAIFEEVARRVPVDFWGYGAESRPGDSPIRARFHGEAWGIDMYRVLAGSRIVLNRHSPVHREFAVNMRLYEATGVGSMLLTDERADLAQIFEPGREIVTWKGSQDCAEKLAWFLDHETERAAIAAAGQKRTLREHTYRHRMQEVIAAIERRRAAPRRSVTPRARTPEPSLFSRGIRRAIAHIPGARKATRLLGEALHGRSETAYRLATRADVQAQRASWQDVGIPEKQRRVVESELFQSYQGMAPRPYRIVADAIAATGHARGTILEVGCASAYHEEVLSLLLGHPIAFTGLDYSMALLRLAARTSPGLPLVGGDATKLPFRDASFDVVLSGTVLLHVPDYHLAITETARVARHAAIFHKTPTVQGQTVWLRKRAYGVEMGEIAFGRDELEGHFARARLLVEQTLAVDTISVRGLKSPISLVTYICRKL